MSGSDRGVQPVFPCAAAEIRNDRIGMTMADARAFGRRGQVEDYIHRENIALFRRKLAEPCTEKERELLLELLAEAEAKLLRSQSAS
jgi:hypothetical protein